MKTQFTIKFVMFALLTVLFPSLGLGQGSPVKSFKCDRSVILVGESAHCKLTLEEGAEMDKVDYKMENENCRILERERSPDSATFTIQAISSDPKTCGVDVFYNEKKVTAWSFTVWPAYYVEIIGPETLGVGDEAVYDLQVKVKQNIDEEGKDETSEVPLSISVIGFDHLTLDCSNQKIKTHSNHNWEVECTTWGLGNGKIKVSSSTPVSGRILVRPKVAEGVDTDLTVKVSWKCTITDIPEYDIFDLSIRIFTDGQIVEQSLDSTEITLPLSPGDYNAELILNDYDKTKLKDALEKEGANEKIINEIFGILDGKKGHVIWPPKGKEMKVHCETE